MQFPAAWSQNSHINFQHIRPNTTSIIQAEKNLKVHYVYVLYLYYMTHVLAYSFKSYRQMVLIPWFWRPCISFNKCIILCHYYRCYTTTAVVVFWYNDDNTRFCHENITTNTHNCIILKQQIEVRMVITLTHQPDY